ncbi:MAG: RNA-binding protein [Oscillospiraceae bacterium]|nr:RNA-binding protein [Oscillospiraceae bacterium]
MSALNEYFLRLSEEDRILVSHTTDMMNICEKSYSERFSNFLDERQAALTQAVLKERGFVGYSFYGGYENASRKVLGVFPEYCEERKFPISALTFKYRENDKLSHRDFLGVFMSRQIKREMIGDIVVGKGTATAFVYDTVKDMLLSEITKIGSVGVKVEEDNNPNLKVEQAFIEKNGSVSSLRLDSVLAFAAGISRGKAADIIKGGGANVNYCTVESVSYCLESGNIFSVRGFGKFILFSVNGKTKKDRFHITVKKFI